MKMSSTFYLIVSMLIAFSYVPILLYGIEPILLYLIVVILLFLSVNYLKDNLQAKKVVVLFPSIMLLTLYTFIENEIFSSLSNWKDDAYMNSNLNRNVLIAFASLSNAFVWSVFIGFLSKKSKSK